MNRRTVIAACLGMLLGAVVSMSAADSIFGGVGNGDIAGTIIANQVAVGNGADSIAGSSSFTYVDPLLTLSGVAGTAGYLSVGFAGDVTTPDVYIGSDPSLFTPALLCCLDADQMNIAFFGTNNNRFTNMQTVIETTDSGAVSIAAMSETQARSGGPPIAVYAQSGITSNAGGTLALAIGVVGQAFLRGTGTITEFRNYDSWDVNSVGGATVANLRGYYARDNTGGTASNTGFYSAVSSGANKWAFYGAGTAASFLGGSLTTNDIILTTATAIKTDTTTAHTGLIQAYDVDNTTYRTFGTLTNGNTPSFALAAPSGGTMSVNTTTFSGLGVAACPMGQTAAVTWSTDDTGNILATRGACS